VLVKDTVLEGVAVLVKETVEVVLSEAAVVLEAVLVKDTVELGVAVLVKETVEVAL